MRFGPPLDPPAPDTRAGRAHGVVYEIRAAIATGDLPRAQRIARHLDADGARAALVVAVVSEWWPAESRELMWRPPEQAPADDPDHEQIADENARLRAEYRAREAAEWVGA